MLHPFQRAGVRYALERRRTFIADEQGLGKTVQALAALEADDAFPADRALPGEHEADLGARGRQVAARAAAVAVLEGRTDRAWTEEALAAEIVVLNYDILEAHAAALVAREPRALVLDESHYVKNPRARRTKVAVALSQQLPAGRAAPGADGHADPQPPRRADLAAARARPARRVRQRGAAPAPLPQRGEQRPPALEPARPLLRPADQAAGAPAAALQAPGDRPGPALERARVPARRAGRDRLAADAAARPAHARREDRRGPARRAARAAEQPAPARRATESCRRRWRGSRTSSSRASRWSCSPSTSRSRRR